MIGDGGRIELGQDFTGHQRAVQTMRRLKHVLLGIRVLAAGVVRGAAGADFSETAIAGGGEGRLGSRQSLPRDDLIARADLHQRVVAVAAVIC